MSSFLVSRVRVQSFFSLGRVLIDTPLAFSICYVAAHAAFMTRSDAMLHLLHVALIVALPKWASHWRCIVRVYGLFLAPQQLLFPRWSS